MAAVVQTIHAYTVCIDSKTDLNLNIPCLQWHLVDMDYELAYLLLRIFVFLLLYSNSHTQISASLDSLEMWTGCGVNSG